VIGDEVLDTGFHVTTPEAPDVQRYLARMVDAGLTHVVLESTSHGLAQHRVTGCEFDIGVVTNITHEHLDYHGTYEAYRAAKGRLFTGLEEPALKKLATRAWRCSTGMTSLSIISVRLRMCARSITACRKTPGYGPGISVTGRVESI